MQRSDRTTGTASIAVLPNGENTIVLSRGANAAITPDDTAVALASLPAGSLLLLQLEVPIESVAAALRLAKDNGARTILDPAPARQLTAEILRCVDFLTPNQVGSLTLLDDPHGRIQDYDDAERAAVRLRRLGADGVVIKLGQLGCFLATDQAWGPVSGFEVQAVDTTAAGDTFNGAFAAALAQGKGVFEAALFANAAAGLSVTRAGAQTSIPLRREVNQFLQQASQPRDEMISHGR